MSTSTVNSTLLSINETAAFLSVSRWTIHRLCNAGILPKILIAGSPKILISDIEDYVSRQREAALRDVVRPPAASQETVKRSVGRPRKPTIKTFAATTNPSK